MLNEGPIIIIDDDDTGQYQFYQAAALLNYPNDVIIIKSSQVLLFLKDLTIRPAMILSSIVKPTLSVFALRKEILELDKADTYTPYIFYSASIEHRDLHEAYATKADGFFIKPDTVKELQTVLSTIINYWINALHL